MRDTTVREPVESRFTWPARVVTIEVAARWKGEVSDTTSVWTYTTEGMCAVEFAVGEEWLVFVEESNRRVRFATSNCDGTERVDRARATLRALGAPIGARAPNGGW